MIKSIFIKYILAFFAIITISFTILAAIISSHILQYSIGDKDLQIAAAAKFAKQNIEKSFRNTNFEKFGDFIYDVRNSLSLELAEYTDLVEGSLILVTDVNGTILLTAPPYTNYLQKEYISGSLMHLVLNNQEIQKLQTLDGVFSFAHSVYAQLLVANDGEIQGALFFCSTSVTTDSFINRIINTVILSCLWVLAATMVLIYFITENIVSPVRAMNKAAKSFALGRFDVRVPVIGRDEIGELAEAFNNMAASLSINEEMQRSFLSNVSHDLRTPMTNIAGYVEGILDGTIPEDKHEYYLNIVSSETHRLSRLVTSMFEITKIQSGERKFNKKNFDICEMARLVMITLEHNIEAKHIDVEFLFGSKARYNHDYENNDDNGDDNKNTNNNNNDNDNEKMYVFADADAIHQVLQNLCENAIKFTPENGLIRLSIRNNEKKIYVSVYNTGTGIPAEDIHVIFNRFYKTDRSRGLDKTGVGLGLFIVKTIIDNHEEKIWVTSEYGKDCEFTFTLQKSQDQNTKSKI